MKVQERLPLGEPSLPQFDLEAAKKLPSLLRFGGSSWTYRGWSNIIYHETYKSDKDFNRRCLGEYVRFPWFRTVGIDSAFYTPLSSETLSQYAELVPENFQWVSKVWERITIPKYPGHPRYGRFAGKDNPDFLNAELFQDEVLRPYENPALKGHAGPFVFQFPTIAASFLAKNDFLVMLRDFLAKLPKDFRYAVELRNPKLLTPDYFQVLNESGVTHCFNHWYIMPSLKEQMVRSAEAGGLQSNFYVARLLTPLGEKYEEAVKMFQPYDTVKTPIPEVRDDVVRLAKRALDRQADAFIIVNNRLEGHSPGTIDAIGRRIVQELN
jgi:uncharacterized protein YecE (DUF72 family)